MRSLGASPLFSCVCGGGVEGGEGRAATLCCTPCLHPLPAPPACTPCQHPLPAPPACTPCQHPLAPLPPLPPRPPSPPNSPCPLAPHGPEPQFRQQLEACVRAGGGSPKLERLLSLLGAHFGVRVFLVFQKKMLSARAHARVLVCLDGCGVFGRVLDPS